MRLTCSSLSLDLQVKHELHNEIRSNVGIFAETSACVY